MNHDITDDGGNDSWPRSSDLTHPTIDARSAHPTQNVNISVQKVFIKTSFAKKAPRIALDSNTPELQYIGIINGGDQDLKKNGGIYGHYEAARLFKFIGAKHAGEIHTMLAKYTHHGGGEPSQNTTPAQQIQPRSWPAGCPCIEQLYNNYITTIKQLLNNYITTIKQLHFF